MQYHKELWSYPSVSSQSCFFSPSFSLRILKKDIFIKLILKSHFLTFFSTKGISEEFLLSSFITAWIGFWCFFFLSVVFLPGALWRQDHLVSLCWYQALHFLSSFYQEKRSRDQNNWNVLFGPWKTLNALAINQPLD